MHFIFAQNNVSKVERLLDYYLYTVSHIQIKFFFQYLFFVTHPLLDVGVTICPSRTNPLNSNDALAHFARLWVTRAKYQGLPWQYYDHAWRWAATLLPVVLCCLFRRISCESENDADAAASRCHGGARPLSRLAIFLSGLSFRARTTYIRARIFQSRIGE